MLVGFAFNVAVGIVPIVLWPCGRAGAAWTRYFQRVMPRSWSKCRWSAAAGRLRAAPSADAYMTSHCRNSHRGDPTLANRCRTRVQRGVGYRGWSLQ